MKKPTVTIGIPAHNEEANIARLLRSVLLQKKSTYTLEAIIISCDGCTDNTADIVREFAKENSLIKLIDDGKRLGKPERLNSFYKSVNSDIFIAFDGDVVLAHSQVVKELVEEFDDKNVGLVGGRDVPLPAKSLFERIAVCADKLWYEVRKDIKGGNTIHNHIGRISALHKKVYKSVELPKDMAADDHFLYFRNKELGREFNFAENAVVFYRQPDNLKDYLKQTARYISYRPMIIRHFGFWVNEDYKTPLSVKVKAVAKMFLSEPLYLPLALTLKVYLRFMETKLRVDYRGSLWSVVESTKQTSATNEITKSGSFKKKPNVTVGIPAYNEEANIKNLLEALLEQEEESYKLEKILVVSDGSTDKTVQFASDVKDKRIKVEDRKNRVGGKKAKSEIISLTESDILVILDADVLPADNLFLENITEPIINGRASLVGADTTPLPAKGLFEKIIAHGHQFKKEIYRNIKGGDNVYLCHGRARAFSKRLYKQLKNFPENCPEDAYSYLFAVYNGFNFYYARKAKVNYRASSKINEQKSQAKRFVTEAKLLEKYFPETFVKEHFKVPLVPLLNIAVLWSLRNPIYTLPYLIWALYIKFSKNTKSSSGKWQMATSSKRLI